MRTQSSTGSCRCQSWASISLGWIFRDPAISESHVLTTRQLRPCGQTPGKPPAGSCHRGRRKVITTGKMNCKIPPVWGKEGNYSAAFAASISTSAADLLVLEGGSMTFQVPKILPSTASSLEASWRAAPGQSPLHHTCSRSDSSPKLGKGHK